MAFQEVPTPAAADLYDISALGDEVWAVGDNNTVMQWTGTEWVLVVPPDAFGVSSVLVYSGGPLLYGYHAGGTGGTYRRVGSVWEMGPSGDASPALTEDGVVVGAVCGGGGCRLVRMADSAQWWDTVSGSEVTETAGFGGASCAGASLSSVFLLGYNHAMAHWNGSTFDPLVGLPSSPGKTILTVGDHLWLATEDGSVYEFFNGGWTNHGEGGTEISGTSADDIWGLDEQRAPTFVRHYNGSTWTDHPLPQGMLGAAVFVAPRAVWVVGGDGRVARMQR